MLGTAGSGPDRGGRALGVPARVSADELGADAGEFVLDGARRDDFDQRAPAGEVSGDVRQADLEPYFTRPVQGAPGYVEFRIGDQQHELGIIDRRFAPRPRPQEASGAVIYWHVDDVETAFERLLSLGATAYEKPVQRGPGFVTASVVDPFGNIFGVMYNEHYLQMVGR
ncbi:VOC family protein [Micromonospora sp. NPDC047738]|uniref:VOC family protein n=1 Tax=unclassified Micromonospora TaxID=2617518 RepID=UPI003404554D